MASASGWFYELNHRNGFISFFNNIHSIYEFELGPFLRPKVWTTLTNRRLYWILLLARPVFFFFFSWASTLGVWPRTLPARAREPWTCNRNHNDIDRSIGLSFWQCSHLSSLQGNGDVDVRVDGGNVGLKIKRSATDVEEDILGALDLGDVGLQLGDGLALEQVVGVSSNVQLHFAVSIKKAWMKLRRLLDHKHWIFVLHECFVALTFQAIVQSDVIKADKKVFGNQVKKKLMLHYEMKNCPNSLFLVLKLEFLHEHNGNCSTGWKISSKCSRITSFNADTFSFQFRNLTQRLFLC